METCGFHCIKVNNLGVTFGEQVVLSNVNLHIHCNSLMAIVGQNGAGKSTLIRALLDDVPHTGEIEFRDTKNGRMEKLRIGYVPQNLSVEKNTPLSVYDLIASYQTKSPVFLWKKKSNYIKIKETLAVFGAEDLIDRQVCNLSGGQLQRVLLSMAILDEPHLLLLDEPVSGVDQNGMDAFYETITTLKREYDLAIILISHDLDYVYRFADYVALLDQTVLAGGTPKEVFATKAFHEVFGSQADRLVAVKPSQAALTEKASLDKVTAVNVGHYDPFYKPKDSAKGGEA